MPETMSSTLVAGDEFVEFDELDPLEEAEARAALEDEAFNASIDALQARDVDAAARSVFDSAMGRTERTWREDPQYLTAMAEIRSTLDTTTSGSGPNAKHVINKSHRNTAMVFERDPILRHLGYSTMGGRLAWKKLPPWRKDDERFRWMDDRDKVEISRRLAEYWGGNHSALSERAERNALVGHGMGHRFSPWRDYIDGLPAWDGVHRIGTSIPTAKGVGTPYVTATLDNFYLTIMERAYDPGCPADVMLVLYGGQGVRKTSLFRAIPPDDLPIAEVSVIPDAAKEKDALIAAHEAPIVLIDEIDKLRTKDDQAGLKAFQSGRYDTWRSPYGTVNMTHARSFVTAATTNREEFLMDLTGNRRSTTLTVEGVIPAEYLTRAWMDLLLAEARDRYRAGERARYDDDAYNKLADEVRRAHLDDPVGVEVHNWLADPRGSVGPVDVSTVSVQMIIKHCDAFAGMNAARNNNDKVTSDKISLALDNHPDYERVKGGKDQRVRVAGQQVRRAWRRTTPAPAASAPAPIPVPEVAARAAVGFIPGAGDDPAPTAPARSAAAPAPVTEAQGDWGDVVDRLIAERNEKWRQWEEANR
ncbi:VapE domain-containing protein [Gordonia malaquae]|uniref:VapE domain-containing protein n=1 Tax=Gordonia malaquae TaxID=410332 RepID=UPI0030FE3220